MGWIWDDGNFEGLWFKPALGHLCYQQRAREFETVTRQAALL